VAELNPNGNPVRVGDVLIRTPGLAGEAAVHMPGMPSLRAASLTTDDFEIALANESVQPQQTIEITGTREMDAGAAALRSTHYDEPAMEIEVPDPGEAWGQMVMYADEAGVMTWNFPRTDELTVDTTRGAGTRRYLIPRRVVQPPEQAETRGLIGAIGKKVLKVLAFPIIDPIVGKVSDLLAARWERKKRPYRIRSFTPSDYRGSSASSIEGDAWRTLSEGRSLLFVHGTFSQAHTGFGGLPADVVTELDKLYGGRVFAFDHFTLSDDPTTNVVWFINNVPEGTKLQLDIVCHSRGGLVSRVLAETQASLSLGSRTVSVEKIVFVASPNAGTVLADTRHMGDFIDSYTNILNLFPFVGVTDVLEGIITVAKHIAIGAVGGLEGLQCMVPGGEFLTELNSGPKGTSRYFALAANFEPVEDGFSTYVRDRLFDKIFGDQNDLVVPSRGVFEANGSGYFPVDTHFFDEGAGVHHSNFFSNKVATEKMLAALT
jgi:pimeloyl-ACP methyl ester carboxylesterase